MLTGFNYKLRKKLVVNKCYNNKEKSGESKKIHIFAVFKKNKSINRFTWNIKNLKIMAATNWTIIRREKKSNQMLTYDLESKWTYKTALGIAIESNNDETHELVCIVETNKMMPKNEKENKKKTGI